MKTISFISLILAFVIILGTHFFYYPKWNKGRTEATLSWDVSGYYMYLPAHFIYNDLKGCSFKDQILQKYHPTPDFQQAFVHESGNFVMKYSIGQAIQFSPYFFIGHIWAGFSNKYPADGFSLPYQFMISLGSLIMAFLGLYFLRLILLEYFDDTSVAISILALILGTNYLNYSAIDGAMTHNYLFSLYVFLIFVTVRFYKEATFRNALTIGALIGMLALIRPTEIIAFLIPIIWGTNVFSKESISERLHFLFEHKMKLFSALSVCVLLGSIQLFYWKYVSGEWIVYSYENQGFSWLKPHLLSGLFSYKSGWLMYTPIMIFSVVGFVSLWKFQRNLFGACLSFFLVFIYIAFAWDIWWYGGSLGQRTMVQAYPILVFPLSSFISWLKKKNWILRLGFGSLIVAFIYLNLWFTHQAHKGGQLHVGQMTKAYYWKTLGRLSRNDDDQKLLDTDEYFEDIRKDVKEIYSEDFGEIDEAFKCTSSEEETVNSGLCLNKEIQHSPIFPVYVNNNFDWIRAKADFSISQKEWEVWKMTQFIVKFYDKNNEVKSRMIRIQRTLNDREQKSIYFDIRKPKNHFDRIEIKFWNANGDKEIRIRNLVLESWSE